MQIIQNVDEQSFTLNGVKYVKNFIAIKSGDSLIIANLYDTRFILLQATRYSDIQLNGTVYPSLKALMNAIATVLFFKKNLQDLPYLGSLVPTSPAYTGASAFWTATEAGTYTNYGNVVVRENSFAIISRDIVGNYTVSQSEFNFNTYIRLADSTYFNPTYLFPLSEGSYYTTKSARLKAQTEGFNKAGLTLTYLNAEKEVDTFIINNSALNSGIITVSLGSAPFNISITAGDTAIQIADKLRSSTYNGWSVSGTGSTLIFTRNFIGKVASPYFLDTENTGVSCSVMQTIAGSNPTWIEEQFTGDSIMDWLLDSNWRRNININDLNTVYTEDANANSFIKELYLVNKNNLEIYLGQVRRNYGANHQYFITINNVAGNTLAVYNFNSITESNNSVIELSELSNSGVYGYIVVDWSVINDNSIRYYTKKISKDSYVLSKSQKIQEQFVSNLKSNNLSAISNKTDIDFLKSIPTEKLLSHYSESQNFDYWLVKTKLFSNGVIFNGNLSSGSQDIYVVPVAELTQYKLSKNIDDVVNNIKIETIAFSSNNTASAIGQSFSIIGTRVFNFDTTFTTPAGCKYVYVALQAGTSLKNASLQKITVQHPVATYPIEKDKLSNISVGLSPKRTALCTWIDDDTNLNGMIKVKNICDNIGIKATFAIIPDYDNAKLTSLLTYQQAGFHFTVHPIHQGWYNSGTNTFTNIADCEDKLITGMRILKKDGFLNSDYLVYPGSSDSNAEIVKMIKKWCPAGIVAGNNGFNTAYDLGRYKIKREFVDFTSKTMAEYKIIVDNAYSNNGWLIFGTHSNDFTTSEAIADGVNTTGNLKELMNYAKNRGLEFKTFNDIYVNERRFIYDAKDMGFNLE